eukprot:364035-Chlamydomonas_euryale.AAC.5
MAKFSVSRLSAYARAEAHLTQQTTHGAIGGRLNAVAVTCAGATLALILFLHEMSYFWKLHRTTHVGVLGLPALLSRSACMFAQGCSCMHACMHMSVDLERRHDLPINIDFVFPRIPCASASRHCSWGRQDSGSAPCLRYFGTLPAVWLRGLSSSLKVQAAVTTCNSHTVLLSVDVLDVSGTAEGDANHAKGMNIHKFRIDADGKRIGKAEYHTPQSQYVVPDGMGGHMMNVNIQEALKVSFGAYASRDDEREHTRGAQSGGQLRAVLGGDGRRRDGWGPDMVGAHPGTSGWVGGEGRGQRRGSMQVAAMFCRAAVSARAEGRAEVGAPFPRPACHTTPAFPNQTNSSLPSPAQAYLS